MKSRSLVGGKPNNIWKILLAALLFTIALLVIFKPNLSDAASLRANLDLAEAELSSAVVLLFVLAVLVIYLPWERLTSLKAAGVELELDNPQINRAIGDLAILKEETVTDEKLKRQLERLAPYIAEAQGGRILWIDDCPRNVFGERRLLRTLGIETVMATSSGMARDWLESDGDFDLLISDMRGNAADGDESAEMREAVQFVCDLRAFETKRGEEKRYSHIPNLPVIFYSGKSYADLRSLTEPIRQDDDSLVMLAKGVEKLFKDILMTVAEVRAEPIEPTVGPTKQIPDS